MRERRDNLLVRLLPSSVGSEEEHQYATSYLINDFLAVDAGSIGYQGNLVEQASVRHVLLTHTHSDHLASLPVLVENTLGDKRDPLQVWGSAAVLECLERDVFNDRVWPRLSVFRSGDGPAVVLEELRAEESVQIEGLSVTPVEMIHTVPTFSFLVDDGQHSIVIGGDSGPSERLWELARARDNLVAVFFEAAFPNELTELAIKSQHLTPAMFAHEWRKVPQDVQWIAVHIKARYRATTIRELMDLGIARLEVGRVEKEYTW